MLQQGQLACLAHLPPATLTHMSEHTPGGQHTTTEIVAWEALADKLPAYVSLTCDIGGERIQLGVAHVTHHQGGLLVEVTTGPAGNVSAHLLNQIYPATSLQLPPHHKIRMAGESHGGHSSNPNR